MTNLEVARAYIENALAYAESGDMRTVISNLEYIKNLLTHHEGQNTEHDWEDFK